jgi:Uma2 family endonuclease
MNTAVTERMTLSEFHELPDDPDVDRELLFGELVEKPMTRRNRWHADAESSIAHLLETWNKSQSPQPGRVFSGEAGCDLPVVESGVGIDVAFFSNEVLNAQEEDDSFIVGAPVVAVEILSLTDTVEEILKKVKVYLAAGVKLVWIVDPYQCTLTVHRPEGPVQVFVRGQEVSGEPYLPGLAFRVDEVFE